MIRKLLITGGSVVVLGLLCFGRDAASYVSTTYGQLKQTVRDSVPMEFEIQRARDLLKNIVPEIRTNMHLIAKEEVEAVRLQKQIGEQETRLEKDRGELMKLKADLSTGKATFQYASRRYTAEQVKCDLANRFERYKTNEATLGSLRQMHEARARSLEAARQKLENTLAVKRQLEVDCEHLEARLKMVEASQAASTYHFDDSQLSRAKELVADLRTRLDVTERLLGAETKFQDQIPVDSVSHENIVDEVTEYFAAGSTQVAASEPAAKAEE
ncbi:MAG: hypothetical protein JSS27_15215 [Planctomycetes bacterium]|nr:hypothetical protein [Planctomycetota bacterium]